MPWESQRQQARSQQQVDPNKEFEILFGEFLKGIGKVVMSVLRLAWYDWPYVLCAAIGVALAYYALGLHSIGHIKTWPIPFPIEAGAAAVLVATVRHSGWFENDPLMNQARGTVDSYWQPRHNIDERPLPLRRTGTGAHTKHFTITRIPHKTTDKDTKDFEEAWNSRVQAVPGYDGWAYKWQLQANRLVISPKQIVHLPDIVGLTDSPATPPPSKLALRIGQGLDENGQLEWVWWDPDATDPHALILGQTKALALDTPILTTEGWTTMGEIQPGAQVFGSNGQPINVVDATDVMHDHACFEVEYSDGERIIADADHPWLTTTVRSRAARNALRNRPRRRTGSPETIALCREVHEAMPTSEQLTAPELVAALGGKHSAIVYGVARELEPVGWRQHMVPQQYGPTTVLKPSMRARAFNAREFAGAVLRRLEASSRDQRHKHAGPQVVTTAQIAATQHVAAHGGRLRANHGIDLPEGGVEHPEAILPVSPYTLGAWLGDGHSYHGAMTNMDPEVRANIEADGYATTDHAGNGSRAEAFGVLGLKAALRSLGVLENKHIPDLYLHASRDQRWAVLEGLMDTDGTAPKIYGTSGGGVEFSASNRILAEQVQQLCWSLGLIARLREKTATLDGRDMGPTYTVSFSPPRPVFRIERKRQRQRSGSHARPRMIVNVREVPSVPVRCIRVDAEDHLFLCGRSLTPTHNSGKSVLMRDILAQALDRRWQVIIADPKIRDYKWTAKLPGVKRFGGDKAFLAVDEAMAEMKRRDQWFDGIEDDFAANLSEVVGGSPFMPVLVILEETTDLITQAGDAETDKEAKARRAQTLQSIGTLVRRSRFVDMIICVVMQRPDAAILGGEVRDNLGTRVLTGEGTPAQKMMAFGERPPVPLTHPVRRGRARVSSGGAPPREIQVPWIKAADIVEQYVDRGDNDRPPTDPDPDRNDDSHLDDGGRRRAGRLLGRLGRRVRRGDHEDTYVPDQLVHEAIVAVTEPAGEVEHGGFAATEAGQPSMAASAFDSSAQTATPAAPTNDGVVLIPPPPKAAEAPPLAPAPPADVSPSPASDGRNDDGVFLIPPPPPQG